MYHAGIILLLLAATPVLAGEKAVLYSGGEPGCLPLVGSRALSNAQIKALPQVCKNFHKNYTKAVQQLAAAPKVFSQGLIKTLDQARASGKTKSPYDAILLATLTQDSAALPALKKYADFEKKRDVFIKYASASLERFETGTCKTFKEKIYNEVCNKNDQILNRLVALNRSMKVGQAVKK